MAAISIQKPLAQTAGSSNGLPPMQSLPPSAHCKDGDFVTLTAGLIAPAVSNPTLVAGIAQHDSNANYAGQLPGPISGTSIQNVLGQSQLFSAANVPEPGIDPTPGYTIVAGLQSDVVIVEINLSATTGWVTGGAQQANFETPVGLSIDGATGFYVADPTVSNLIATIVGKPYLPGPGGPFGASPGGNGDTGARVFIRFDASAVQPIGH